MMPILTQFPSG